MFDEKIPCACRLAKQVNLFYGEVLRYLGQPPLNAHFDKSWTAHVSVKAMLYDAEAWIQQGAHHGKETEANIQIACLRVKSLLKCKFDMRRCLQFADQRSTVSKPKQSGLPNFCIVFHHGFASQ